MRYPISIFAFILFILSGCGSIFENEQVSLNYIWVSQVSAPQQCIPPTFADLEAAVSQLESNKITVSDSSTTTHMVCEACSCPTGIIYNALILKEDLTKAESLGWQRVDEGDDTAE